MSDQLFCFGGPIQRSRIEPCCRHPQSQGVSFQKRSIRPRSEHQPPVLLSASSACVIGTTGTCAVASMSNVRTGAGGGENRERRRYRGRGLGQRPDRGLIDVLFGRGRAPCVPRSGGRASRGGVNRWPSLEVGPCSVRVAISLPENGSQKRTVRPSQTRRSWFHRD